MHTLTDKKVDKTCTWVRKFTVVGRVRHVRVRRVGSGTTPLFMVLLSLFVASGFGGASCKACFLISSLRVHFKTFFITLGVRGSNQLTRISINSMCQSYRALVGSSIKVGAKLHIN